MRLFEGEVRGGHAPPDNWLPKFGGQRQVQRWPGGAPAGAGVGPDNEIVMSCSLLAALRALLGGFKVAA